MEVSYNSGTRKSREHEHPIEHVSFLTGVFITHDFGKAPRKPQGIGLVYQRRDRAT